MKYLKKSLKIIAWSLVALVILGICAAGTFWLKFRSASSEVTYLSEAPRIDGILEASLSGLPVRTFAMNMRMGPGGMQLGAGREDVPVRYRMAYGAQFLYLHIEMEAPDYVCRDRGYQNGDGFVLVLGRPRPWSMTTDDNFVLGFSPQDTPSQAWARKIVWNRDYKTILSPLGENVQFAWKKQDGRVGFELLLPWQAVQPFHPWIQEDLGFNLLFMKAIGQNDVLVKSALPDLNMARGTDTNRYISRLSFQNPPAGAAEGAYLAAKRNHVLDSEAIELETVAWSDKRQSQRVDVTLEAAGTTESPAISSRFDLTAGASPQRVGITFDKPVPPGRYMLKWQVASSDTRGSAPLVVFSAKRIDSFEAQLQANRNSLSQGSADTLAFRFGNFRKAWAQAKYHEPLGELSAELEANWQILQDAAEGRDTLLNTGGYLRRGFRSNLDGTFQPYSVVVPPELDRNRKYPLLVYLHGSERDDRELKHQETLQSLPGFIVMAPKARGMSNFYLPEAARADVMEAIDDVCRNYPVDPGRIVLSGFSMGGYGVYRLFHHAPTRFAGLAVLSGEPVVPALYQSMLNEKGIDYRDEKLLPLFRDIPMFIFHGKDDRNCPFELTEQLAERLRTQNPRVETRFIEGGHDGMSTADQEAFLRWLTKM